MKKSMVWDPHLFKEHYETLTQTNIVLAASEKRRLEFYLKELKLKNTDTVLDVGCGYGRLSKLVSNKVKSVIGIDINPENILYAKKYVGDKFQGHVLDLSLGVLPFPDKSVDKIIIDNVLMFFSRQTQVVFFKEAKRVLQEQGILAFNFENSNYVCKPLSTFFTCLYGLKAKLQGKIIPVHYSNSLDFYTMLLGELGFDNLQSIGDTFYRKMGIGIIEVFPKVLYSYVSKRDQTCYNSQKKNKMSSLTIAASLTNVKK